jgi:hypothetical protein
MGLEKFSGSANGVPEGWSRGIGHPDLNQFVTSVPHLGSMSL